MQMGPIHKSGFTLVELIVVVAIISVLASIGVPIMTRMRAMAVATEGEQGLSAMATSLQQYYIQNGKYPNGAGGVSTSIFPGLSIRLSSGYGSPATDGRFPSLDGQYFSQDCYSWQSAGPSVYVRVYNTSDNTAPKANETRVLLDDQSSSGIIFYYYIQKKFYQRNCSKTGFPPG
jgi:prepilin-type N-terminal cleavage/methylation domain-containing protein